ncbi:hypothetical protein ACKI2C_50385, partial [Streptomyces brasiliscabiei]|uniref:hypothetical protein n=1 Tax=Streptomyces brasiliscabiei TaxID=2736302 RepID=UPI0038F76407
EINLGFEKALTPEFNGGVKFTYRKLKNTIDDYSDPRAILKKLSAADQATFAANGNWNGILFNPGQDATLIFPLGNGQQRVVSISAA